MFDKREFSVAAFTGLLFGLISYIVLKLIEPEDALLFAVFSGLMMYLGIFIYLLIHNKRMKKRYEEIEKTNNIANFL